MKNILITGCSRGIGFETVKKFAIIDDVNILAVARNSNALDKLKLECKNINHKCNIHTLSIDLSKPDSFNIVANYIKNNNIGTLDVIINNAGLLINKSFSEITLADLEGSFKVNAYAPFLLTQKLMPFFSDNAHTIFISTMGGVQGSLKFPGLSAYSSSKSTLMTLTECLAEEYKSSDWVFNCLALGAVQTEMLEQAFPGYQAPLSAQEMAIYIYDFALNGKRYFNGKIIPISLTTP
jgi:3-oxoacyl-[acyl-carrier protein] reductase